MATVQSVSNFEANQKKASVVRAFRRADIAPVADLYQRVFLPHYSGDRQTLLSSLCAYFEDLFFASPWQDEFISSLVCVDGQGQVAGFIGVIPRRMNFKGRPVLMANCFHFMAEPNSPTLAGVQLLKALLSGPQDFTLTDHGGDLGRRVWEGLGGTTALAQSFNWARLLRPVGHFWHLVSARQPRLSAFTWLAAPLCKLLDALLTPLLPRWLAQPADGMLEEELEAATLLQCSEQFSAHYALRPVYDERTLGWLVNKAGQFKQRGPLQKVLLRDAKGNLLGSFLYYLNPGGPGLVLHLTARKDAYERVLEHLFWHAWQRGATALKGRLDPRWMRELTNKHCRFDGEGGWTMVHSNEPELLQAIYQGEAWLTRLEGEWCILYQPGTSR